MLLSIKYSWVFNYFGFSCIGKIWFATKLKVIQNSECEGRYKARRMQTWGSLTIVFTLIHQRHDLCTFCQLSHICYICQHYNDVKNYFPTNFGPLQKLLVHFRSKFKRHKEGLSINTDICQEWYRMAHFLFHPLLIIKTLCEYKGEKATHRSKLRCREDGKMFSTALYISLQKRVKH